MLPAFVRHGGNVNVSVAKGVDMFKELTEELLDLRADVRGYGAAVYAVNEDGGGGGTLVLCCTCTFRI